ncbi:MAG: SGNH/GDSL hydrolase family protein, partial [Betaproteobacteria bacterium]|nr:SGNH/GDSL hydrolase family protein [Betaproteobacteria bacterium]
VICTMCPPRYPEPVRQRAAVAALTIFNWRIFRRALEAGIAIVDLRNACSEGGDYADHALLSKSGLQKCANIVWRALWEVSRGGARTEVFW